MTISAGVDVGTRYGARVVRTWRGTVGRVVPRVAVVAVVTVVGLAGSVVAGASTEQADTHPAGAAGDASYTAGNLPGWAIGPFNRSAANPLLTPSGDGFQAAATYNPGVLYRNGRYQMLYRGQATAGGPSQIGYASSVDGVHFAQDTANNPVINFAMAGAQDKCGLEDPRLFESQGTYYSFFTSVHPKSDGTCYGSFDISESTSTDAIHWSTPSVVEPNTGSNKDAAVVTDPNGTPVRIDGEYVMYFGQGGTGADIAYSDDLLNWHAKNSSTPRTADPIDLHYPKGWQPYEVCVAVTDYQTVAGAPVNHGIVLFTAGTLMANQRWFYAISEEQFSRTDPTRMLHQLSDAVLTPSPDVPYEWNGQTPKTVWMNDIFFHNGRWMMYYGGGDTVTGLATAALRQPPRPTSGDTSFRTGFEHGQPMPDWIDSVDTDTGGGGIANVTAYQGASGPESSVRQEQNHDGTNALLYSGQATAAADDHASMRLFDLSGQPVGVRADTTLSYWIYPQANGAKAPNVSGDNSSCAALDLVFADGSALRNVDPAHSAAAECGRLSLDQWNHVTVQLGAVAAGKKIVRVDLDYDQPGGSGGYRGYVDDIALTTDSSRPATITSVGPAQAAPGERVTITGTGFGHAQGDGRLLLSDAGVNWGGPGDLGILRVDRWTDRSITFTVPEPSGPAVSTSTGPTNLWRIEPGSTASVAVVTGPASVSNSAQFGVADTDVLADYANDVGISPDTNRGCGALDDGTDTYSADSLATAAPDRLTPGARLTVDGLSYTWPAASPCDNDNVRALGQTILLPARTGASTIGFLGAATNGNQSGAVTIHYADGSTGTATLAQTDWGTTPGTGNVNVAHVAYRNQAQGPQTHDFYVNEQRIAVDPGKTVASITLPTDKNMHIFAISENGTPEQPDR